jgi:hypothetical protein
VEASGASVSFIPKSLSESKGKRRKSGSKIAVKSLFCEVYYYLSLYAQTISESNRENKIF